MAEALRTQTAAKALALIGQPNVGKSVLFSRLTRRYVACSNYPGTTVELFRGIALIGGETWQVIDTPGVVDLASSREDEGATRDLLLFGDVEAVLQVADAKNPERALALFAQLAELGLPLVLDLNMADERRARGLGIPQEKLSQQLGVPVLETVATTGEGLEALLEALPQARIPRLEVDYGPKLEAILTELAGNLASCSHPEGVHELRIATGSCCHGAGGGRLGASGRMRARPRDLATLLLALSPPEAHKLLAKLGLPRGDWERIDRITEEANARIPRLPYEIALARQRMVNGVLRSIAPRPQSPAITISSGSVEGEASPSVLWGERLARWTVHPVGGVVVLLGVLYAMYLFVGMLGAQVMVDWLETTLFGEHLNPALFALFERYVPLEFLQDLFVGEYGIFTMALTYSIAIILPIVTTFFLAFGFLEDSGYFARLAVMAHRLFRKMGLSGQAVLPMILGLGCDTMATVTTRTLETSKERVIATLLLALGVPCSAQMAVLLAMSAAVSPWVLTGVLGIVGLQILIVGRLAARLLPGAPSPFILELPPLRRPRWQNIAAKTWMRLVWYATEVVPLFVLGTLALFVLDKIGVLAAFQALTQPVVVGLLDLPQQAAQAFIMGFFRRDYGAAGLYQLQQAGALDAVQVLVSLVTITLFVPCIANFLVIVRERGWRTALGIVAFVLPYAVLVGAAVNAIAHALAGGG